MLENIFLVCLFIFGVFYSTEKGKLLEALKSSMVSNGKPNFFLAKTIISCPGCMGSLYGVAGFVYLNDIELIINKNFYCLSVLILVAIFLEISIKGRIASNNIKSLNRLDFISTKIQGGLYLLFLSNIIVTNDIKEAIFFVFCVCGLCFLIEHIIVYIREISKTNETIENTNNIILQIAQKKHGEQED